MSTVEVQELCVRYGTLSAVDRASFVGEAGQVVAILGPNGAGKTSTVKALSGFQAPHLGSISILGANPYGKDRWQALASRVAFMPQSGGVHPGLRPLEALQLYASFYDQPEKPSIMLQKVGLGNRANSTYRRLSGGEQQRLSLGLALIGRPQVLILDEPTSSIDLDGRRMVRELIDGQRQSGTCVVMTTHDLSEAERLADRIVILDHGRIVADGTPKELLSSEGTDIAFNAPTDLDVVGLGAALGATVQTTEPGEYTIAIEPNPANVAALTSWLAAHDVPLGDLRAGKRRLEDLFDRLTGEGDS